MIFYHATSLHTAATIRQKRPCCVCFLMFSRLLMLSRSRCFVYWICQQRSTASITSFCCSDFDETLRTVVSSDRMSHTPKPNPNSGNPRLEKPHVSMPPCLLRTGR